MRSSLVTVRPPATIGQRTPESAQIGLSGPSHSTHVDWCNRRHSPAWAVAKPPFFLVRIEGSHARFSRPFSPLLPSRAPVCLPRSFPAPLVSCFPPIPGRFWRGHFGRPTAGDWLVVGWLAAGVWFGWPVRGKRQYPENGTRTYQAVNQHIVHPVCRVKLDTRSLRRPQSVVRLSRVPAALEPAGFRVGLVRGRLHRAGGNRPPKHRMSKVQTRENEQRETAMPCGLPKN